MRSLSCGLFCSISGSAATALPSQRVWALPGTARRCSPTTQLRSFASESEASEPMLTVWKLRLHAPRVNTLELRSSANGPKTTGLGSSLFFQKLKDSRLPRASDAQLFGGPVIISVGALAHTSIGACAYRKGKFIRPCHPVPSTSIARRETALNCGEGGDSKATKKGWGWEAFSSLPLVSF